MVSSQSVPTFGMKPILISVEGERISERLLVICPNMIGRGKEPKGFSMVSGAYVLPKLL